MADFSVRDILHKIQDGNIRIPAFQRGFVWDADSVAYLMDSIYKGYPFGTIQLWRTKETLKTERQLGPFSLFERDPEYPIDYVLDGQQRITSIFGVFQTDINVSGSEYNPFKIYFDLDADSDLQETQFFALEDAEVDKNRHFPLNALFDTKKYREATNNMPVKTVEKIDELQSKFKEVQIPYQILETDNKAKVAIVFERINRRGQPLDIFQLLSAWTWSEEFNLQSEFETLKDELKPYGFDSIGENINLLLRIISAILTKNASAKSLIELNGTEVRNKFGEIINGLKGSIDFLKANTSLESLSNIPYENILAPLSVFFSCEDGTQFRYTNEQRKKIMTWFWKTCFSKRYSAGILRALNKDIEEMIFLKENKPSKLGEFEVEIKPDFFINSNFLMGSVNTKTFILLLAQFSPRSFITGSPVSLKEVLKEYNRNEFHHIYPRSFLTGQKIANSENSLANFSFMSKSDNNQLGGVAPSVYKGRMDRDLSGILSSCLCQDTDIFEDKYDNFITKRAQLLTQEANKLINI